jgi:hypothetical protein
MGSDIQWCMWATRQWPFNLLEDGTEIVYVSGGGPHCGRLMWTVQVTHLVQEPYESHEHAWELLSTGLPRKHLKELRVTRSHFLEPGEYIANAAAEGWLMAWVGVPTRWVNKPRPTDLLFRPNGWTSVSRRALGHGA